MHKGTGRRIVKIFALALAAALVCCIMCGCRKMVPIATSDKYFIGFDYSSYADPFGMAPVIQCVVRYDKSIDATFTKVDENGERYEETQNFKLTDKQYEHIWGQIDSHEVYYLDPKCSDPAKVMDGGSCWLYVYGEDDELLRKCGGFCPRSERFHEIRRILFDNLPDELLEAYAQYEKEYTGKLIG